MTPSETHILRSVQFLLAPPNLSICTTCGAVVMGETTHECRSWAKDLPGMEEEREYKRARSYCVE